MVVIAFLAGALAGTILTAIAATFGVDALARHRSKRHDRRLKIDGRLPSGRVIHLEGWRRR